MREDQKPMKLMPHALHLEMSLDLSQLLKTAGEISLPQRLYSQSAIMSNFVKIAKNY